MTKNSKDKKNSGKSHKEAGFSGYTMDQLRYQIALTAIKREFLKERAKESTDEIKKQVSGKMPISGGSTKGILGKFMKGLDLADYILLGFQGFRLVKKMGAIFRRR